VVFILVLSLSVTDPGQDSFSVAAVSCGSNGVQVGTASTTVSGGSFVCSFPDGPADSTVSVQVKDSDVAASNTDTQSVHVANVAPTVTLSAGNAVSVPEGQTRTYNYSISDPGTDTVQAVQVSCGVAGEQISETHTDSVGSLECRFPDGPASSSVSMRATDSDGSAGNTATQTVGVTNVVPVVTLTAGNDVAVNEGTQHTYAFTVSDPGVDSFHVSATSCGGNGSQVGTTATTAVGGSFVCSFPDGPKVSTVSVQVTDSDGAASNSANQAVTVANLPPSVGQPTVAVDPVTGVASFSAAFTDPGAADTFPSGRFDIVVNGTSYVVSGTVARDGGGGGGTITGTFRLASGCYAGSIKATATVSDSDGASGTSAQATFGTQDVYAATWKDPIRDNERNIAKYGNVVPVKLALASSCTGAAVTSPTLFLTYVVGNVGDDAADGTPNVVAESVSNADTDNQMRLSGGMYMYNLSTKPMTQGKDYTIRVRVGSSTGPVIKSALFQPKK
jgi:hypothetical protein